MARLETWREELYGDYVVRTADEPFAWGERDRDCVLWAAGGVEAQTGVHPAEHWIGRYSDARGAYETLLAGGGLTAMVTDVLGPPLPAVRYASPGDVVEYEQIVTVDGVTLDRRLGLCDGPFVMCKGVVGVVRVPLSAGRVAWAIGR